jgi:hypothetical protein
MQHGVSEIDGWWAKAMSLYVAEIDGQEHLVWPVYIIDEDATPHLAEMLSAKQQAELLKRLRDLKGPPTEKEILRLQTELIHCKQSRVLLG